MVTMSQGWCYRPLIITQKTETRLEGRETHTCPQRLYSMVRVSSKAIPFFSLCSGAMGGLDMFFNLHNILFCMRTRATGYHYRWVHCSTCKAQPVRFNSITQTHTASDGTPTCKELSANTTPLLPKGNIGYI